MDQESFQQIEKQLAELDVAGPSNSLRDTVLSQVQRELRAARWDRRMARAALVLLAVGIGMNAALAWRQSPGTGNGKLPVARHSTRDSLVETATVVAEATDAETGRRFAQQLAAARGRELSRDELHAIDAAAGKRVSRIPVAGSEG